MPAAVPPQLLCIRADAEQIPAETDRDGLVSSPTRDAPSLENFAVCPLEYCTFQSCFVWTQELFLVIDLKLRPLFQTETPTGAPELPSDCSLKAYQKYLL